MVDTNPSKSAPLGGAHRTLTAVSQMVNFIEDHRVDFGVEPICKVLPIATSTYYHRIAIARDPERASDRAKSDQANRKNIQKAWEDNHSVYGAKKVWHALCRQGKDIARCTVERLIPPSGMPDSRWGFPSGPISDSMW